MDFIQRMTRYFVLLRRQLRRHRRLVVALACAVVFATTYALTLPAVTLDEQTANDQAGIELGENAAETQDGTAEAAADDDAQQATADDAAATGDAAAAADDAQQAAGATADAATTDDADATDADAAADDAEGDEAEPTYLADGTTLAFDGDGWHVTAQVNADAQLPEGTELAAKEITADSDEDAYDAYHDAALAKLQERDGDVDSLQSLRLFDISFVDKDGNKVEPAADVKVSVTYDQAVEVEDASKVEVVHFDDDTNEPSVLSDDRTSVDAPDDQLSKVEFTSSSFSVYAITETTDTSKDKVTRRMYTFLNDDGSEYDFTLNPNPAGGSTQSTNTQVVKNGDTLQSVGTPEAKVTASQGKEFLGWKVTAVSNDVTNLVVGNMVSLPTTVTGIAQDDTDETVTLQAVFDDAVYLTFYDSDNATVIYHDKVAKDAVVNLSSYHAAAEIPASGSQMVKSFVGWATTQDSDTALDSSYSVNGQDATFYPVYKEGYWLYFSANDNDSDVKATFTESEFIAATTDGVRTTLADRPTDPQRQGYTFGGWYTDSGCTQRFDFATATLTGNTTLYAKWTPASTTYNVVVWRQRVTDNKDAADDAKTYDYGETYQVTATTGETISSSSNMYSGSTNLKSLSGGDYTGFHYAAAGTTRTDSTSTVTVRGDGSSTINVYYDRDLITMNFYTFSSYNRTNSPRNQSQQVYGRSSSYGSYYYYPVYYQPYEGANRAWYYVDSNNYYQQYNGNYYVRNYSVSQTFTGLYGQTLNSNNYTWPADSGPWRFQSGDTYEDVTYMSFLGEFVLPDNNKSSLTPSTVINFYQDSSRSKTYYFYLQNADGTWPDEPTVTATGAEDVRYFNLSEKYQNFTVSAYQLGNGGSGNSGTWTSQSTGYQIDLNNYNSLGVRYTRKSYNVEFYNGSTHLDSDQSKLYEASLSNLTTPDATTLTYPGNASEASSYQFVGWFADPECTTYVSFGSDISAKEKARLQTLYPDITGFVTYETMPGHNLPVYAGWKAIRHTVTFDPNGGTIPGSSSNEKYVESVLLGQSVRNATASNVLQTTYTDEKGVTYTLIGWYKVNEDGTETLYNFGDAVTEDITLKAHWRQSGQFYVRYVDDDTAGTLLQDDSIAYADQSDVRVLGWPSGKTVRDGYVFAGWTYEGKIYLPGETILMDANKAVDVSGKKTITLVASYTQLGTTFLRYDANGGQGNLTDPSGITNDTQADIPLNKTTTLSDGSGFSREDYVLVGWNHDQTAATSGTVEWNLGETVGVDGDTGNTLYAVWHKPVGVKKVDGTTAQTALSGATFKLTKQSDGTDVNVNSGDFYGSVTVGPSGFTTDETSSNGLATLGALKDGTYRLTETKAPDGYVISTSEYTFTVRGGKVTLADGTSGASVSDDGLTITITNTPGDPLPNSGGTGTAPFAALGAGIAILATLGLALRRRKRWGGDA